MPEFLPRSGFLPRTFGLALILLALVVACGSAAPAASAPDRATPATATTATSATAPTLSLTSPETDRKALIALHYATDGGNWKNRWVSGAPMDELHGVPTDGNGRVIELALWGNQLRGEIPPELGSLANLWFLDLHGNRLSGEIPPELGSLVNLKKMSLDGNRLSGCVPASLRDQLDRSYSDLSDLPFCFE